MWAGMAWSHILPVKALPQIPSGVKTQEIKKRGERVPDLVRVEREASRDIVARPLIDACVSSIMVPVGTTCSVAAGRR